MYNNIIAKSSLSILQTLRYLEWIFIAIHILLVITTDRNSNLVINFVFYSIFIALSLLSPWKSSQWQKQ
ncbi:MAG: hypothetical protein SWZ49_32365, partial [Cyanobacteriota bacterium]|nr:hypothetical protein [Cyanobacteriota bacterium]